ncbi:hypothetical protein [Sphingobium sp.]|uniref:hypothetical protein n=1 Tax=Sphingobium sp. TaxID=1912891 RepID=UPI0039C9C534
MDEKSDRQPGSEREEGTSAQASRRRVLMLGAATATTVLTVRPALAQSAASVLNCSIPVPDGPNAGKAVAADGSMVAAGTQGSFPGGKIFKGEDVKNALRGGRSLPGTSYSQSQAYINYIRRLQYGRSGFTCYASLQMPR